MSDRPTRSAIEVLDRRAVECNDCTYGDHPVPTLKQFGPVSVRMYADDHRPPHVHIVGPEFEVLVRIADAVVVAGTARPREIAEALAWVRANQTNLVHRWAVLNERG